MNPISWRTALTLLLLLAAAAAAWFPQLDAQASQELDAGIRRAMATFATARVINAAISVLQEFSISVGVTIAIGQALDPINDIVEQFSTLMLVALVSMGVQKVLLAMGGHLLVKVCVVAAILGTALAVLMRWRLPRICRAALIVLLLIRFVVPVALLGSHAVFKYFLHESYQSHQQGLDLAAADMNQLHSSVGKQQQQQDVIKAPSLLDRFKSAVTPPDLGAKFEDLKQAANRVTDDLVQLMVVFLLQTLLVPLFFLWLMIAAARAIGRDLTSHFLRPRQERIAGD
ncbi:hypothetical protein DBR47_22140 [Paucibacter sp. KBW04]|uniref:hypothetical protein n=1 Tax=Paucibacter sp. KBW04 TaxID=2153361 RepID=UPI000F58C707|nr:hypothetical protein [Paucibacter sp. KBW04]RQO54770.1 hypothetical protein DBR47_22140 [Paucibacter sp. KBW04]